MTNYFSRYEYPSQYDYKDLGLDRITQAKVARMIQSMPRGKGPYSPAPIGKGGPNPLGKEPEMVGPPEPDPVAQGLVDAPQEPGDIGYDEDEQGLTKAFKNLITTVALTVAVPQLAPLTAPKFFRKFITPLFKYGWSQRGWSEPGLDFFGEPSVDDLGFGPGGGYEGLGFETTTEMSEAQQAQDAKDMQDALDAWGGGGNDSDSGSDGTDDSDTATGSGAGGTYA